MPTESRERTKQSLDTRNGGKGSTTEEGRLSNGAPNHSGSNGVHRPRSTTLTQAMSADNSPTRAPFNRSSGNRRVKDFIGIKEELAKRSREKPTVVENDNGQRPTSRSRARAGVPPPSKSTSNSRRDSFEHPSAIRNSDQRVSEITELPPSPKKKDPAPNFDLPPTQVQMLKERRAASKDINRRPSTADRRVEKDKHEDIGAVKQNGLGRSFSLDKRSTSDRKSSPAAPNRRLSQPFTHTRSSGSSGARRTEQPEPRSSSTASRQAERKRSLGGNNGSNPHLKQEAAKRSSPSFRAGKSKPPSKPSSDDGFLDFEVNAGYHNYGATKSSSSDVSQEEEPANSAMRSYAWHEGVNVFNNEIDAADDGRLYTRKQSRGVQSSSRQEDASDLAIGSRRISLSKRFDSTQDNHGSHFPAIRRESNGSLKQEDQADRAHRPSRQGRTGGNLKQDNAADSWAGTRERIPIDNTKFDLVKFRSIISLNRNHRNVKWLLKGVAAASYNGGWLPYDEMVPYPDDIVRLNKFLNDCRNEVEAGVPGRFLTVVLGHENSDLDSIMSTITYAYFLSSIGGQDSKVVVPVINMRQENLVLHTEAVWLFKVAGVDISKLLFVDQISLQYYHRFGNLKLVLVDHSRLAPHQETLQDAVIEIVDHNLIDELYSWVPTKDIQQVGSCCTIITERFVAEAPELLAGRGLNRLLLGPILCDTANLDPKSARCTARDQCMAAFLVHGAGRYGQEGFFRLLKKMQYDVSTLTTIEILRKDFKQWTLGPGKTDTYGLTGRVISAAMSTLSVPLKEIMTRKGVIEDLRYFGRKSKLDLHLIVTGYYDKTDRYKREILIVPGDMELKEHVRACFRPHKSDLQLSYILIPGLPDDMLVYKQGLVTASRTMLRQILKDYFEM